MFKLNKSLGFQNQLDPSYVKMKSRMVGLGGKLTNYGYVMLNYAINQHFQKDISELVRDDLDQFRKVANKKYAAIRITTRGRTYDFMVLSLIKFYKRFEFVVNDG